MSLNDSVLPENILNEAEQALKLFKACSASFKKNQKADTYLKS
jgi:hypothetical protein